MKTAILAVGLLLTIPVISNAKNAHPETPLAYQQSAPPSFLFLRGHKHGWGHSLQWSMSSNAGIDRFEIQYTYEDPTDPYSNWYTAGFANNTYHRLHMFTDMGPLPGFIHYRVIAQLNNNAGVVISETYSCQIGH